MDAESWRRVERVLDEALTRPPEEWAELLDRSCSGDPALRLEVEALLGRLGTAREFLESPPAALARAVVAEAREAEAGSSEAGRRIGAYRIVRQIGRGGMARVFLAERDDGQFRQEVALKLLRPGLDSDLDLERFRSERQILASLNHPNIAQLLDGGVTAEGQPYLVLELVQGQPIDAYCSEHALPVEKRLELFLEVAEATQYAHRRLVVHRDLKPSNILVGEDGRVKLLDFGLAKLLEPSSDAAAPTTRAGQRWMTPEYAAPEQIRGLPVTTLTDVYQLGAVLYQLLTGRLPFPERGGGLHELEEAVLHREPDPPSAVRGGTGKVFRGDLDAIVLKALRKEPEQRFGSVQALADDLRRHRSGHPVLARRQTAAYRTRRFIGRHRGGLAVVAVLLLLIGVYAVTITIQRERIRNALTEATLGTRKAEQVTDFMMGLFYATEGGKALTDTVTARELLGRGLSQARELTGQPEMQAQMLDVIGRLYNEVGEYDRARPLLEEALEIRRRLRGTRHPDYVTTLENLADVAFKKQELGETLRLQREALALRREISGPEDPKSVNALFNLAFALHRSGQDSAAIPRFDEWLSIIGREPRMVTPSRANQLIWAAEWFSIRGQETQAGPLYREALAIRRELYGDSHHAVASSLLDLGAFLDKTGRKPEGEESLRKAVEMLRALYPDGHPTLGSALRSWGLVLLHLGRFKDAEAALRECLALRRRFIGENTIDYAMTALDLSIALSRSETYDEAVALARDGGRILRQILGPASSMVTYAGIPLGDALRGQGKFAEAESLLMAGFKRFETPRPVTLAWRNYAVTSLTRLYEAQGKPEEAARYRALVVASVPPPQSASSTPR